MESVALGDDGTDPSGAQVMPEVEHTFWDYACLRRSATLHALTLGGKALLFDEASQQLYEQNETSAAVWQAIQQAATIDGAARALAGSPDAFETLLDHVRAAAVEWMRLGFLRPEALIQAQQGDVIITLGWQGCTLEVRLGAGMDRDSLGKVFAPFIVHAEPDRWLTFQELSGLNFMSDDRGRCVARRAEEIIPEVKAAFTEEVAATTATGFLAHAALLSRNGEGLMICGEPGAGKSTLSLSLILAGFSYHSDDVVWIGEDGHVTGLPFAPAMKEGSWRLMAEMGCELATSAVCMRADGRRVRYVLDPPAGPAQVDLRSILLLQRCSDGRPRIEPVAGTEVLRTILGSAYSARGSISAETLQALVRRIGEVRAGRLHASDWRDDQRLVKQFVA